ncbi:hypothetical protein [Candidatus Trichorickettsia mobilis]|nr:hypothetical protein [Candidatus Trichorickettsia mobilis]
MTELSQLMVMLRGVYSTKREVRKAIIEKLHVDKLHLDLQYDDNSSGISEKLCDLLRTLKIEELSLSPQQLSSREIKLLIANLPKTIKSLNFVDHQHTNEEIKELISILRAKTLPELTSLRLDDINEIDINRQKKLLKAIAAGELQEFSDKTDQIYRLAISHAAKNPNTAQNLRAAIRFKTDDQCNQTYASILKKIADFDIADFDEVPRDKVLEDICNGLIEHGYFASLAVFLSANEKTSSTTLDSTSLLGSRIRSFHLSEQNQQTTQIAKICYKLIELKKYGVLINFIKHKKILDAADIKNKIVEASISLEALCAAFEDNGEVLYKTLSTYVEQVMDFNTPLPDLGNNTLLQHIFGYVNNKDQLLTVMQYLKAYENIDWNQKLPCTNGNNILEIVSYHNNILQEDIITTLQFIAREYGIKLHLNSFNLLRAVTVNSSSDLGTGIIEVIKDIEDVGHVVNDGLMAAVCAYKHKLSLYKVSKLLDFNPVKALPSKIFELDDILCIAQIVVTGNTTLKYNKKGYYENVDEIEENFQKLAKLGFNQWQDDFGEGKRFLDIILEHCTSSAQLVLVLSALSKLQNTIDQLDFNQKTLDRILTISYVEAKAFGEQLRETAKMVPFQPVHKDPCVSLAKIIEVLSRFDNINWDKFGYKLFNDELLQVHHLSFIELMYSLEDNKVDMFRVAKNDGSLIGSLLSQIKTIEELTELMSVLKEHKVYPHKLEVEVCKVADDGSTLIGRLLSQVKTINKFKELIRVLTEFNVDLCTLGIEVYKIAEDGSTLIGRLLSQIKTTEELIKLVSILTEFNVDLYNLEIEIYKIAEDGSTLIGRLLSQVKTTEELIELMSVLTERFKIDLNHKIGINEDHIISLIPLPLRELVPILHNFEITIKDDDWLSTNKDGVSLLAKILQNKVNMNKNYNYLLELLPVETLMQPLDKDQNTLPFILVKCGIRSMVGELFKFVHEQDIRHLIWHINYKNRLGETVMDLVAEEYTSELPRLDHNTVLLHSRTIALIKALRTFGSDEPRNIISTGEVNKLDLAEHGFESPANKVNTYLILQLLYQKCPFSVDKDQAEAEIDEQIKYFKDKYLCTDKEFRTWINRLWDTTKILYLRDIIEKLSEMRDVSQFIAVHWDFKKVLAAIIYVLRHSNSEEDGATCLAICLRELYLCSFGKLVNLLSVVQNLLIEEKQFNYEHQEFSSFLPVLDKMIEEIKSRLGDQAPSALTEWFLDISRGHFPENWTRYTLKIQGIINEVFAATGDYFDSSNFLGLRNYIIRPLIEKLINTEKVKIEDQLDIIQQWHDVLKEGIT